eukprot:6181209-Pleurochrysis_carterae.AAC.3
MWVGKEAAEVNFGNNASIDPPTWTPRSVCVTAFWSLSADSLPYSVPLPPRFLAAIVSCASETERLRY